MLKLVIGNRNYSSWSLRVWFYMRASGLEFKIERIPMFTADWAESIAQFSSAGRVPVLLDGNILVWDSVAIMGYLRDKHPGALGWPADPATMAHARSVASEMHSGFLAVRDELPQNLRARNPRALESYSPACRAQMARIIEIWTDCRGRYADQGPWLFGGLCIADVMYTPVAMRFQTYGIDLPPAAREFQAAVLASSLVQEWCQAAAEESESIAFIDDLVAAEDSPLTLG